MEAIATLSKTLEIATAEDMEGLGWCFGEYADKGDVLLLTGALGTGKTCFSRGYIRGCLSEGDLAVTSPSYLLDNTYDTPEGDLKIHHMDLYRMSGPDDLHILDIPDILYTSACLIEWPDRLGEKFLPPTRLEVHLDGSEQDENKRVVRLCAYGSRWTEVLQLVAGEKNF